MSKLSLVKLKKQLAKRTKSELIGEITQLVKKFKQVEEYYFTQENSSNIKEVLNRYKEIIEKEFIEGKTRGMPKVRFSVARKALTDFKKINKDPKYLVELMLCYTESISSFSSEFGPKSEEFYTKPENMFEEALILAKRNRIEKDFKDKAHEIVEYACEGCGHQESLRSTFEEIYGEFIE